MLEDNEWDSLVAESKRLGAERGKADASWVFNGNTPRKEYVRAALMIKNGDPELWDKRRNPLSGEFSDDYTVDALFAELETDPDTLDDEERTEICDVFDEAHADAWYEELERIVCEFLDDNREAFDREGM